MASIPRVRMFAGPNGSGKSTVIDAIDGNLIKLFLNADNLERDLNQTSVLDLCSYHCDINPVELIAFLRGQNTSGTSESNRVQPAITVEPTIQGTTINFTGNKINSYLAARILDFIREKLLDMKVSFTFETVMSHSSKIDFLKNAKAKGYRTYLYFVTTEDADINVSRVRARVLQGGHNVDEEKIRTRYTRTMKLLIDAVDVVDRAFLFDNSKDLRGIETPYIAEIVAGDDLILNPKFQGELPIWFENFIADEFYL
jgi:predicted ABC-type ATPase